MNRNSKSSLKHEPLLKEVASCKEAKLIPFNFTLIIFLFCLQVSLVKSRVILDGLTEDMWKAEHYSLIAKFVMDTTEQLLVIFIDERFGLTVCKTMPPYSVQQISYFVREENARVTADTFPQVVQFGTVHGSHVDGLLRSLHGLYAPTFFEDTSWPDSILWCTEII